MRRRSFGAAMRFCLLLMLLVGATKTSAQDNCILNFIEQPIASVDCNIYEAERIILPCTVTSAGVSTSVISLDPNTALNIKWFFNNGTDYELTTGINETRREGGNGDPVMIGSTLAISVMPKDNVASLAPGLYYCRVQVNDETMRSNSSQKFTAETRDEYFQYSTSCLERSFIAGESACAVHNIVRDPSTTTPNPSTTDPDVTSSTQVDTTSPSSDGNQSTEPSAGKNGGGGATLQVWIYVLVAVAAVFAMIIIILAIMCVGLCLRRSQTMDENSLKKENGGMQGNFILSHSSSMVNNEMYRGAGMGPEETDFTGTHGTHFTSHSQISDDNYNTLGERDYEVINVQPSCDSCDKTGTQDYHRLQRPSPPAVPTGRNAMFGFSPPNGEFRSMSTLTSQMNGMNSFHHQRSPPITKHGYSTLPLPSRDPPPPYNGNGDSHVYGELENPATTLPAGHFPNGGGAIYRSPTSSSPPDSAKYFEHVDSATELLPPLPARGTTGGGHRKASSASTDSSLNESLYNPCFGGAGQQSHPLEKIPETGTMFPEPPNPTAFPVNEYDYIPTMTDYEKPVASKKGKGQPKKVGENPKTRVSTKSMNYETDPNLELRANDTADCMADLTDVTGDSITGFKLPLADDTTVDSSDFTGASDMHFPIGLKQNGSVLSVDYTGASEDNFISSTMNSKMSDDFTEPKKDFQMNGMCYPDNSRSQSRERRSMSRERRSFSQEAPSSHTSGLDNEQYGPADIDKLHTPPPPSSSTLPQSRRNPYKELDTSSLKAHLNYAKLQVGPGTVV